MGLYITHDFETYFPLFLVVSLHYLFIQQISIDTTNMMVELKKAQICYENNIKYEYITTRKSENSVLS